MKKTMIIDRTSGLKTRIVFDSDCFDNDSCEIDDTESYYQLRVIEEFHDGGPSWIWGDRSEFTQSGKELLGFFNYGEISLRCGTANQCVFTFESLGYFLLIAQTLPYFTKCNDEGDKYVNPIFHLEKISADDFIREKLGAFYHATKDAAEIVGEKISQEAKLREMRAAGYRSCNFFGWFVDYSEKVHKERLEELRRGDY